MNRNSERIPKACCSEAEIPLPGLRGQQASPKKIENPREVEDPQQQAAGSFNVAMTIWENRISPVADWAVELLIVGIVNRSVQSLHYEFFRTQSLFDKAKRLSDLGVNVFVCGAISNSYAALVEGYGIRVIPFKSGQAGEILNSDLLEETWTEPDFPGRIQRHFPPHRNEARIGKRRL